MNRVILMGRLTRDPDVRYSQGGEGSMAVARYTLAVDRRRTRSNPAAPAGDGFMNIPDGVEDEGLPFN